MIRENFTSPFTNKSHNCHATAPSLLYILA
jgi:hypothetical protein